MKKLTTITFEYLENLEDFVNRSNIKKDDILNINETGNMFYKYWVLSFYANKRTALITENLLAWRERKAEKQEKQDDFLKVLSLIMILIVIALVIYMEIMGI